MDEKTAIQAARVLVNSEQVRRWGAALARKFTQYENARREAELKWARNARQFLGIYDPEVEQALDPNKSRAYPKLTRVKCVSMLSRLMNLLFNGTDSPFAVEPTPVPNIDAQDLAPLLAALQEKTQAEGRDPSDEEIEAAIYELAKKRAERLEREIKDQLRELGGSRSVDYVALCRKVLMSGIQYGMGVLKGPMAEGQKQRRWEKNAQGQLVPKGITVERPRFEFVPIWDYYPDMSAKTLSQMDGQFIRMVMSKHQVLALKNRKDFLHPQIDAALAAHPDGNYKRRTFETEVRAMGVQNNVPDSQQNKYEAIVWEGYVYSDELHAAGAMVPSPEKARDIRAEVWFIGDIIIKADVEPWVTLVGEDEAPPMYHHFIFEEDESTLTGNGLPNIVRDSQMGLCAAVRMALDNGSVACGMQLEVNTELLSPHQDVSKIVPNKIWYRDDVSLQTMQIPAVKEIKIDSQIDKLKVLSDMFLAFADQETFIGPATGGDMSRGPSEPLRSAAGASMLRADQALPFKDVVRNFDIFNQSVIASMIVFNRQFNKNPGVRGDFQAVARGATSLMAKEVLGMQLDNLAQSLTEEEKMYIDFRKFARARVKARDLPDTEIVVNDAEADRREQAEQEARTAAQQLQTRVVEAEIKDTLSNVLKNIAQAAKNSAGAEATAANVILAALEKGISPNALSQQIEGARAAGSDQGATPGAGGPSGGGAGGAAAAAGEGPSADGAGGPAEGAATGSANAGFAPVPA